MALVQLSEDGGRRDEAWIRHLAEHGYVAVGDVVSRAAVQSAAEL